MVEEAEGAVGIMMIEGEMVPIVTMTEIGATVETIPVVGGQMNGQVLNGETTLLLLIAQDETLKRAVKTRTAKQIETLNGPMVETGMHPSATNRQTLSLTYLIRTSANVAKDAKKSNEPVVEIVEPIDEDLLIEERRKKREALKAKYRGGGGTPLLATALGLRDTPLVSPMGSPADSTDITFSPCKYQSTYSF